MEPGRYILREAGRDRSAGHGGPVLIASGADLDALCTNLLFALCDCFVSASTIRTSGAGAAVVKLDLEASSREQLVAELADLVLDHQATGTLLPVLWAPSLTAERLHGEALGERFDYFRHRQRRPDPLGPVTEARVEEDGDGALRATLRFAG